MYSMPRFANIYYIFSDYQKIQMSYGPNIVDEQYFGLSKIEVIKI